MGVARWLWLLRVLVGPIALLGFFLPWAHGPGVLAANEFTGYTLVGVAGRFQQLDLGFIAGNALVAGRLAVLGFAIAALWQTLLAPWFAWHVAYAISGWYLVAMAVVALGIGIARAGLVPPPSGLALTGLAALLFLIAAAVNPSRHRSADAVT
jgi:hypothetical protein